MSEPVEPEFYEDKEFEKDAEAQRATSFDAVGREWRGRKLQAFSISRWMIFNDLRNVLRMPSLTTTMVDNETFFSDAVRIVWLCAHGPQHWEKLRPKAWKLILEIDKWADANVSGEESGEICLLAAQIYSDAFSTLPVSDDPGAEDDGGK